MCKKLTGIVILVLLRECIFQGDDQNDFQHCDITLEIKNCENGEVPRPWIRRQTNELFAVFKSLCEHDDLTFNWFVYEGDSTDSKKQTFMDQSALIIKPFALPKGDYDIILYAVRSQSQSPIAYADCSVKILTENPIPYLAGGNERTVISGDSFVVDGQKSRSMDSSKYGSESLQYSWKCKVVKGADKSFCEQPIPARSVVVVPKQYVKSGHTYEFTLSVKNSDSDWISTSQVVKILDNVVSVKIDCRKNCSPHVIYTDTTGVTYFKVVCLVEECEKVGVQSYEWILEEQQLNYDKDTEFGRNDARFIIKENVLQPGKKYKVRVEVKGAGGNTGSAVQEFETGKPPSIQSCKTNPSSGIALDTIFGVDCQYKGSVVKLEIYTAKKGDDKKVLLATAVDFNQLKFKLFADNDVFIKIIDDRGLTTESQLDVKVTSNSGGSEFKDSLKNTVNSLAEQKNYEQATQIISGLLFDVKKKPAQDETDKETKMWIMAKLDQIPLDSEDQVKQIASLMANMADGHEKNSDADIAEKISGICKKLAEKQLQHATENSAEAKSLDTQQVTKDLMSCVEADTQENAELLKPNVTVHVEPPFPPLPVEVITENYPDYVDDEKSNRNIHKLDIAAKNSMDICVLNAKTIALKTITGEGAVGASSKFCEISVTKNTGDKLVKTLLKTKGAVVTPSFDFKNIADEITSTICIWTKNPFWWMSKDIQISTNVVLIKFSDSNKNYTTFQDPVTVSFEVTEKISEPKIHDIAFPTPGRYIREEGLSVVRVEVKKNEAFFVEFHLEDFQTFRVVLTDFYKPTFEEVQSQGKVISKSSGGIFYQAEPDYDGWYYISILPENEQTKQQSQYRISVFTFACYTWNMETRGWSFGCKATAKSNSKHLECDCWHLSVLAGITYNNAIRIENTNQFQYIMVLLATYGIFIATSVTFLIYCIMILFARKKKQDNIYVLADVSRFSRYLYFIVVQTGARTKSGTTSNICIKVYGTRGESKEHVLNYPDPEDQILKRGHQDFFVLTNEYYLGNLTKIDLWFDCIGRQPAWFCESVIIYDVQTKEYWYFQVNRWLSLHPQNEAYVTTETVDTKDITEKKEKGTKHNACLQKCKKVTATLCTKRTGSQSNLSFFAKCSIFLSVLVTIYGLVMVMYGMPNMNLRDGFTTYDLKFHWTIIVIPICSALITFIAHAVLIWLWKLPKFSNKIPFWSFLTVNIILWISVLVIFGFWMPFPKMWLSLIASAFAVLLYYLIILNIYNKIRRLNRKDKATTIATLNRTEDLIQIVETQRRFLFKEFGEAVLRPYLSHLYLPLDKEAMKKKKQREEAKMQVIELLSDMVMFLVYICLLYWVILANKDSLTIVSYQKMLELLSGEFTRTEDFEEIGSIDDTYTYLNNTLIPATQSLQWYGKFVVDDPGMMKDYDNKYLGVVRLRQHRVIKNCCKIPQIMNQFFSRCLSEFSISCKDKKTYGVNVSRNERMASIWNYTKWSKAEAFPAIGTISRYPGGGYVAPLGRTMTNSIVNLNYLHRKDWINLATRAVFVEFIAYNANANLFTAIRILIEYSATGYVKATHDIKTVKLLFVKNETEIVKLVAFLAFVVTLVVFSIKLFYKLWHKRKFFFRDLWLVIDLIIVLLSFGCFVLFFYRMALVGRFLTIVEKAKKNEFVNYFTLFHLETILSGTAAFLVCIATIRLWKLLRFGRIFLVAEKTILLSATPILSLLLCQIVLLVGFALAAHIAFGTFSFYFKQFTSAIVTLVLLSLHLEYDFDISVFTQSPFGYVFYTVYWVTTLVIYTVHIVIICLNYTKAQEYYSNWNSPVKVYVKNELMYIKKWFMFKINRLRGGVEHVQPKRVTPKADEHRYADCTSISKNKLELMAFIVKNKLEDQQLANDRKIALMLSSASRYLQKESDNKEIFFKGQDENKKLKLVRDNKMIKIEKVVEGLLGKKYRQEENVSRGYERAVNRHMRKLNRIQQVLEIISKIIHNVKLE